MAGNGIHFTRVCNMLLPVGFRFRPTEEELVRYYLQMKLEGMDYVFRKVIPEINICDYEPRHLPRLSPIVSDNKEWYFFSTYKKNSRNQTQRATKEGFWKITGTQKPVKTEDKRTVIGEKRILTFKQGCVRDYKNTDWVMHEYYIPQTNPNANQGDLVLCCVREKPDENMDAANCHERESSTYNNASDFENQQLLARRMDIQEEHTQQQPSTDYFERALCSMLDRPSGNDYQAKLSANCHERESSTYNNASDFENQQLLARRMDIQEEHTQQQPSTDYFERALCSMLDRPSGNDYQAKLSANCHERESSTYNNASDFENQQLLARRMDIEEEHTQPRPSLDYFEREKGHMLANAHGNKDFHELQSAFGANEQDENFTEFLNSVIVDGDQDETTHANIFNDSTLPQLIRRVYFEDDALSSDTDTEEMSLKMLSEPPVDSSHSRRQEGVMLYQTQAASSVNVVPKPQTDRVQVVTDEHSGTHRRQLVNDEHSGTHQRTSRPQCELRHNNALNVKNASSVDVDADLPQINGIRFAPDEYYNNERTHGRTNPTNALEALSKQKELKQQQSKAKEAAECPAAVDFPPKKTSITKSNKEAEVAQGHNAEKGLKQTQNATTTGNWKGCFISWETSPPLTNPPPVHLFNMVLGVIMYCIFAWEEVLYGQWC